MSANIDPLWGVPAMCIIIAGAAYIWVRVTDRAFTRRYGPDPSKVTTSSTGVKPSRIAQPSRR